MQLLSTFRTDVSYKNLVCRFILDPLSPQIFGWVTTMHRMRTASFILSIPLLSVDVNVCTGTWMDGYVRTTAALRLNKVNRHIQAISETKGDRGFAS